VKSSAAPVSRMGEGEAGRVQGHARSAEFGRRAVLLVAEHRVPLGRQMKANLVGAPGLETRAYDGRKGAQALGHLEVVTARRPPTGRSTMDRPSATAPATTARYSRARS